MRGIYKGTDNSEEYMCRCVASQLRTRGTLCANCASTPLHSLHFPYTLPQHHLPLQDPSLDPMRVLHNCICYVVLSFAMLTKSPNRPIGAATTSSGL